MSHKYELCGHVKIVMGKDSQLHALRCSKKKRHPEEEHQNDRGDRWRS